MKVHETQPLARDIRMATIVRLLGLCDDAFIAALPQAIQNHLDREAVESSPRTQLRLVMAGMEPA